MKEFIVLIFLTVTAIGIFFGCCVLKLQKKNRRLQADRNELIEDKNELIEKQEKQFDQLAKQSDQLRQKGIEIDELKKELDKYSDVEPKVALTSEEKQTILNALNAPQYKARVEDPKTKHFTRVINRNLKEKIKESIKK